MRVRVYYNIRKHCLSVMNKATRRVIGHTAGVSLKDVKFVVSQSGVARIRLKKRKAVVAFVEGELMSWHASEDCGTCKAQRSVGIVKFNPYKWDTFVLETSLTAVTTASYVTINGGIVKAYDAA